MYLTCVEDLSGLSVLNPKECYYVYVMNGSEVESSEWTIVDYVDDDNYRLEMD